MFLRKSFKKFLFVTAALAFVAPAWAAGPPAENPLYNPLSILLICLMFILLIVIGILGSVLTGAADISLLKWKKQKEKSSANVIRQVAAAMVGCLLFSPALFAQDATAAPVQPSTIGGLTPSVFYVMIAIVFLELLVILVLLVNVRFLIKTQKEKLVVATEPEIAVPAVKKMSWWNRFNKFKPLEQEADLDLGHDYDGIRELNNRLPPWWIYGFYVTIIVAAIYLWRYHVSHTAPLSKEEYQIAMQRADEQVREYLKQKGETVDENSVVMLGNEDVTEGKKIFQDRCITCHNEGGAGSVGPNLADDYWMHGGDIKSVFKTIKYGINAMPTWQNSYSNKQIAQLASYVKSLHGTSPANAKAPQGELYNEAPAMPNQAADSTAKKENKVVVN